MRDYIGDFVKSEPVAWLVRLLRKIPWIRRFHAWFLKNTPGPSRPEGNRDALMYVATFINMRRIIGALGIALPPALVLWHLWLTGEWIRSSISQYYHSSARDLLVGGLWGMGLFLIAYKRFERSAESRISTAAGLCAIGVATFPTNINADELCPAVAAPDATGCVRKTDFVLKVLGEDAGDSNWVMCLHLGSAAGLFLCMTMLSFFFGGREGRRKGRSARENKKWRRIHYGLGLLTSLGTVATIVILEAFDSGHSAFWGETLGIWAFALSWLAKGWERDFLKKIKAMRAKREEERQSENGSPITPLHATTLE